MDPPGPADRDGGAEPVLARLGFDADLRSWFAAEAPAGSRPGRLARADRVIGVVLTSEGPGPIRLPRSVGFVAGDWVAVADEPDGTEGRVAAALAPRRGALVRADPDGGTSPQVLAAHVDVVLLACGLDRPVRPGRIARALVLAWESGAEPVLVLTKADVLGVGEAERAAAEAALSAPGVDVIVTSTVTGEGIDELSARIGAGRTAVLLGESGAGKSSLVNHLAGSTEATGGVRAGDAKGRHTTTARHLVPLPGGGALLDTPGLRQLGLWSGEEGLAAAFSDVEDLAGCCRFSDCAHQGEPGCEVAAAVEDGRLSAARLEAWSKLRKELDQQAGRVAEHVRRAGERKVQRSYRATQAANRKNKGGR